MYEGNKSFIFISYSRIDLAVVKPVIDSLEANNYRFWYDAGLQSSADWTDELAAKIDACSHFIVFVSENSHKSKYVKREVHLADKKNKIIHPIFIDDVVIDDGWDMIFGTIQTLKLTNNDYSELAQKLFPTLGSECVEMVTTVSADSSSLSALNDTYDFRKLNGLGSFGASALITHKRAGYTALAKFSFINSTYYGNVVRQCAEAERDILAMLQSPFSPALYDYLADDKVCIIVEKYISGLTFSNLHIHDEKLGLALGIKAAKALEYLHHNGDKTIIHRDIKPDNIILDRWGNVFVIDMNTAKLFKESEKEDEVHLGTRDYASPEHFRGVTDARSDIFSLGKTMHKLLANVYLSDETLAIFSRMTQDNPEERYNDISDVIYELEQVFYGMTSEESDSFNRQTVDSFARTYASTLDIKEASVGEKYKSFDEFVSDFNKRFEHSSEEYKGSEANQPLLIEGRRNGTVMLDESTCMLF